jgi:hypothetical protein
MGELDGPDAAQQAAGSALAALVGLALGGPTGAVVGSAAAPPLTALLGRAMQELRGRQEANAVEVVVRAARGLGESPEELVAGALADEHVSRLLLATLQAAAASLDADKVDALARCLANGASDTERVDDELLMTRALADLDPVHVRTLAYLADHEALGSEGPRPLVYLHKVAAFLETGSPEDLDEIGVAMPVKAVLERHGLVRSDDGKIMSTGPIKGFDGRPVPRPQIAITGFGERCLEYIGRLDIGAEDQAAWT